MRSPPGMGSAPATSPGGRMRAVWASKRRRASSQVRSRISVAFRVEETAAIESTSDSRNVVCA